MAADEMMGMIWVDLMLMASDTCAVRRANGNCWSWAMPNIILAPAACTARQAPNIATNAPTRRMTVFACFGGAQMGSIEELGIGLTVAVFIDATIVRCLLVPATMTLLGKWNWWATPRLSVGDFTGTSGLNPDRLKGMNPATAFYETAHGRRVSGGPRTGLAPAILPVMMEPDIIESRSRLARRRPWVWMIAAASLVGLGFVVVRGHARPVAVQPPATAAAGRHSLAGTTGANGGTASSLPQAAAVPSVSRATVEQKIRALGVSLTQYSGYETGQVTDSVTGAELHVTVYLPDGGDLITSIQCVFIMNDIKVDAQLVARAAQCVLPAVPATDQAAVSSWLTANGTGVPVDVPRLYDIDGLRVSVSRIAKAFSAGIGVPLPATG